MSQILKNYPRPPKNISRTMPAVSEALTAAYKDHVITTQEALGLVDRFVGAKEDWSFRFNLINVMAGKYEVYGGVIPPPDAKLESGARKLFQLVLDAWK